MKATLHIPTVEFGFIEIEVEGTEEEIINKYSELFLQCKGGFGLERKEFNAALDRYLTDGTGEVEIYMKMDKEQQRVFQEIKKSLKKLKKKK